MTFGVRGGGYPWFLALLSAALLVGACGDYGPDPTGNELATIDVTVTADGAARPGVTVRLLASGSQDPLATKQTGSNGIADFRELEAGTYDAEIDVPAGMVLAEGQTTRKSATVAAGGSGALSFSLVTDSAPGAEVVEIHLTAGNRFDPSTVTISVGTTVRWISDTDDSHTITPSGHTQWQRQEMNTSGQTFEHTFQSVGTFNYICEPHESIGMTGSITVQ